MSNLYYRNIEKARKRRAIYYDGVNVKEKDVKKLFFEFDVEKTVFGMIMSSNNYPFAIRINNWVVENEITDKYVSVAEYTKDEFSTFFTPADLETFEARIKELEARNMAYEYDEAERARHPAPVPRPMKLVFKQDRDNPNKQIATFKFFGEERHYAIFKDGKRYIWKLIDATPFMEFKTCNDYTDGAMQAQAHFDEHVNLLLE